MKLILLELQHIQFMSRKPKYLHLFWLAQVLIFGVAGLMSLFCPQTVLEVQRGERGVLRHRPLLRVVSFFFVLWHDIVYVIIRK